MKYTRPLLKKLEALLDAGGYLVRYEKGHFQSGYCLLRDRRVVVVNKFFPLEGRIQCLLDLMTTLDLPADLLDDPRHAWLHELRSTP